MPFHANRLAVAAALLIGAGQLLVVPASATSVPSECDQVTGNLLVNCGFETRLAGWTVSGATGYVDTDGSRARTGVYGGLTHPTAPDSVTLSQTVATTAGHEYEVRFFLYHGGSILNGPSFQAQLTNGASTTTLVELASGTYYGTWQPFEFRFTAAAATVTLSLVFPGYWDFDDVSLFDPMAPTVTAHPASVTVAAGTTQQFTAAASGAYVPSVKWQQSVDGTSWGDIADATSSVLSVTATYSVNGYRYRAVFWNDTGTAFSNAATLTVVPAAVTGLSAVFDKGRVTVSFTPVGDPVPTHFQCLAKAWASCASGDQLKGAAKTISVRASWDGVAWGETASTKVGR